MYGLSHANELKDLRRQLFQQQLPYSKYKIQRYDIEIGYRRMMCLFRKPIFKTMINGRPTWAVPFPGSDKSVVQRTQHFNYTQLNKKPVRN